MNSILARSSRWLERCRSLLMPFAGVQIVSAGDASGIHHIVADLRTPTSSPIWLKLEEADSEDLRSVANKLSRAVERFAGGPVFGVGLPVEHGIAKLVKFQDLLGPYLIVISRAHFNVAAVSAICSLADHGASILLVVPDWLERRHMAACTPTRWIDETALRLSLDEVRTLTEGHMPEGDALQLAEHCGFRFGLFMEQFCRHVGLPPLLSPEPDGYSFQGDVLDMADPEIVLNALKRRGALMDAFELSAREFPWRAAEFVDEVGSRYAVEGLNTRFKATLERLPRSVLEGSDSLMRWWFSSATNLNQHRELRPTIERYLETNGAPELRALYAAAFPSPALLAETQRAVEQRETVVTLRMHGFALAHLGSGDKGLKVLMRALAMAEAFGDVDQTVATATDICNSLIKRGFYRDAHEWAEWALEHHYAASSRDDLRRLSVMGLLVFARILTDQPVGLEQLVAELSATEKYLGIPGAEAVVSTVGDWYAINDQWQLAAERYQSYLDSVSTGQYPFVAPDIVIALVRTGRRDDALRIGLRARSVSKGLDDLTSTMGALSYALAIVDERPTEAESTLLGVITILAGCSEAYRLAQASVAIASLRLRAGDAVGAREALMVSKAGLSELGRSGWRLLAGSESQAAVLQSLYSQEDPLLEIRLLGDRSVVRGGTVYSLTARCAECVAVLASKPEGMTGEHLAVSVHGDWADKDTLRSALARVRTVVPLSSRPYSISVPYRADFLELLEHLKAGQLRQALSLYKGQLLRDSDAPAIVELREQIDEALRQAVLQSEDGEAMLELARRTDEDDLELLEGAYRCISRSDPQSPLLRARIRQLRRQWASEA